MNRISLTAVAVFAGIFGIVGCAGESDSADAPEADELAVDEQIAYNNGWSTQAFTPTAVGVLPFPTSVTISFRTKNHTTVRSSRFTGACIIQYKYYTGCTQDQQCGGPGNYCFNGACYLSLGQQLCVPPVPALDIKPGGSVTKSVTYNNPGPMYGSWWTLSVLPKDGVFGTCSTQENQQNPALCARDLAGPLECDPITCNNL